MSNTLGTDVNLDGRNIDEKVEMAECTLALIEARAFRPCQTESVRIFPNALPDDCDETVVRRYSRSTTHRSRKV